VTHTSDYKAYMPPDTIIQLPENLHRATDWQQTKRMLAYKNTLMDKINAWSSVAFLGVLAILILMLMDMI